MADADPTREWTLTKNLAISVGLLKPEMRRIFLVCLTFYFVIVTAPWVLQTFSINIPRPINGKQE